MRDTFNPLAFTGGRPDDVFAEFFDQYDLRTSKAMLWEWFKATTTENYSELSLVERENIATFYERIDDLMDTMFSLRSPTI